MKKILSIIIHVPERLFVTLGIILTVALLIPFTWHEEERRYILRQAKRYIIKGDIES